MNKVTQYLLQAIQAQAKEKKAQWLENYVKHDVKSYGVGIPEIRKMVKAAEQEYVLSEMPLEAQKVWLTELIKDDYTEPKLATILYLQLFWKMEYPIELLDLVESWLDQEYISDWNVCDWLCVRLLSPLVDEAAEVAVPRLASWADSAYLWKARAALVPFAQCKSMEEHQSVILEISEQLIARKERFCKTAVGWVLRQYSKIDPKFTKDFLQKHEEQVTKEVERNATKYL